MASKTKTSGDASQIIMISMNWHESHGADLLGPVWMTRMETPLNTPLASCTPLTETEDRKALKAMQHDARKHPKQTKSRLGMSIYRFIDSMSVIE